ncbi:CcdB family protein [Azovibrio restrictus]|uniref:CcdB family protein n=1 Tax=Azovibrio restrictus TaxID=146938 RepID=UPI000429CF52|nr:CcdB family protein [Azovibrio restrictus]
MHQFDVYPNPNPDSCERLPYLVVLQSDLLERLDKVVVAPLRSHREGKPILRLNPLVQVAGDNYFVRVQDLAAMPVQSLHQPICNLSAEREALLAALSLLFTGL